MYYLPTVRTPPEMVLFEFKFHYCKLPTNLIFVLLIDLRVGIAQQRGDAQDSIQCQILPWSFD